MKKKIELHIPKPCHEDWDKMTQVEKGKFCGSCQKQVVDFTRMNDEQVLSYFKKPFEASVCGRFQSGQLNRQLIYPKRHWPFVKYFFQFTLPAFLFASKGDAQKGKLTGELKVVTEARATLGLVMLPPIEAKDPLPQDTAVNKSPLTDEVRMDSGKYVTEITKPDCTELMGEPQMAELDATDTIIMGKTENHETQDAVAANIDTSEVMVMGGVVTHMDTTIDIAMVNVIASTDHLIGDSVYAPIKRLPELATFRVYPNPVAAGASIMIKPTDFKSGNYSVAFIGIGGQRFNGTSFYLKTGQTRQITVPKILPGIYFVELTASSGKVYVEKIIID